MTAPRNVNRCTPCLEGAHARCSGSAGNIGCGCIHAAPVPRYVVLDDPLDEPAEPPIRAYLVAGGTPAALALARALDDPEQRARLEEAVEQLAEFARITVRAAAEAFARAIEAYSPAIEQLREAGVLPHVPPENPRARALWLRQHRGTGPDRQVQHRPRPRRIA